MATYYVRPDKQTLHGSFSKSFKPILTINSGDSVRYSTLDALWGVEPFKTAGDRSVFETKDLKENSGHALCGPIAINDAKPGMVLKININEVRPAAWGCLLIRQVFIPRSLQDFAEETLTVKS